VPTPKPPKYDDAAHADRVRKLLSKRLDTLPLAALVKLQDVAALLEAGQPLSLLLAREMVGRKGATQIQPREVVERGERSEAAVMAKNAALEEEERATIGAAVAARRGRFRDLIGARKLLLRARV
jgi:hypothetical protein